MNLVFHFLFFCLLGFFVLNLPSSSFLGLPALKIFVYSKKASGMGFSSSKTQLGVVNTKK
jgi:hypothetical protein